MKTDYRKYINSLFQKQNILNKNEFDKINNKINQLEKAIVNHHHSINTSGSEF